MPWCTHVLILDLSPHSDLMSTSVCCCSPVSRKAWYLCVKCASTSYFGKELHQSSQTQASTSNQRLLYSQITQKRKPSRNILQLPCGWLSSSFWPSFIGTWHTWAQLWFEEKLLICYLLCFECAMVFCRLSWGVGKSFRGGAFLEGRNWSLQVRLWGSQPSSLSGLSSISTTCLGKGPAVHVRGMSSTMPSPPPWTVPSQTMSQNKLPFLSNAWVRYSIITVMEKKWMR